MKFEKAEIERMLEALPSPTTTELDGNIHAKLNTMLLFSDPDAVYAPEGVAQVGAAVASTPAVVPRISQWILGGQLEYGHFIIMAEQIDNDPRFGNKTVQDSLKKGTGYLRTSPVKEFSVKDGLLYAQTENTLYQLATPYSNHGLGWQVDFANAFPILKEFFKL